MSYEVFKKVATELLRAKAFDTIEMPRPEITSDVAVGDSIPAFPEPGIQYPSVAYQQNKMPSQHMYKPQTSTAGSRLLNTAANMLPGVKMAMITKAAQTLLEMQSQGIPQIALVANAPTGVNQKDVNKLSQDLAKQEVTETDVVKKFVPKASSILAKAVTPKAVRGEVGDMVNILMKEQMKELVEDTSGVTAPVVQEVPVDKPLGLDITTDTESTPASIVKRQQRSRGVVQSEFI